MVRKRRYVGIVFRGAVVEAYRAERGTPTVRRRLNLLLVANQK